MARRRVDASQSKRFALDGVDLRKLGTGFLIAFVGAVATILSDAATSLDFGMWSPFISMAISVIVNSLRKWVLDNSAPPPASVQLSEATRDQRLSGWTTETIVLVLTALTLGLLGLVLAVGRGPGVDAENSEQPTVVVVPPEDRDDVTRVFVLQRQLFARVCLEAAKRERSGLIASEEAENAWCEPRWATARSEAFGLLAEIRDRQLQDGWTPETSAVGLEAWAVAADPNLAAEVSRR